MDCTLNEDLWRDLEEKIRKEKPDVVGISVICTAFVYDGMNAASLIKAANSFLTDRMSKCRLPGNKKSPYFIPSLLLAKDLRAIFRYDDT